MKKLILLWLCFLLGACAPQLKTYNTLEEANKASGMNVVISDLLKENVDTFTYKASDHKLVIEFKADTKPATLTITEEEVKDTGDHSVKDEVKIHDRDVLCMGEDILYSKAIWEDKVYYVLEVEGGMKQADFTSIIYSLIEAN